MEPVHLGNLLNKLDFQMISVFSSDQIYYFEGMLDTLEKIKEWGLTGNMTENFSLHSENFPFGACQLKDLYMSVTAFHDFVYKSKKREGKTEMTIEHLRYSGYKRAENQLQRKLSSARTKSNDTESEYKSWMEEVNDGGDFKYYSILEDGTVEVNDISKTKDSDEFKKKLETKKRESEKMVEKNREQSEKWKTEIFKELDQMKK